MFKLGTIPSNYLIDKNGTLVAENVTPESLGIILHNKLESPQ
jgi:hypothetical protein